MIPWFIAIEQFSPTDKVWEGYIEWSGLTQLREVVSLDHSLCPSVVSEFKDGYWDHMAGGGEDSPLPFGLFTDFQFLQNEVAHIEYKTLLCVFLNPNRQPPAPTVADFRFLGYDLLDVDHTASALTNCGGFPDVFSNSELAPVGLLTDFERAVQVQSRLRLAHPEETHADCNLWAVFRLEG